ncbi:MAG: hypothetical protein AAF432_13820 [Planctomycetota bacterium]
MNTHTTAGTALALIVASTAHADIISLELTVVDFSNGYVFADGTIHAESAHLVPDARPPGTVTYRVWANVESATDTVTGIGGDPDLNLNWDLFNSCNDLFYVDALGTDIGPPNPNFYTFVPSIAYDSWWTLGSAGAPGNPANLTVFDDGWVALWSTGQTFQTADGGILLGGPGPAVAVPGGNSGHRVLLGQLTTTEATFVWVTARLIGSGGSFFGSTFIPAAATDSSCCLFDGTCVDIDPVKATEQCLELGGLYNGTICCSEVMCPPSFGACCLPDGSCERISPAECATANGTYLGDGVLCRCPTDCAPRTFNSVGNGIVNVDDLVATINMFGTDDFACDSAPLIPDGPSGNGIVNIDDILAVINDFGVCESACE